MFLLLLTVATVVNLGLIIAFLRAVPIHNWLIHPFGALMILPCVVLPVRFWFEHYGVVLDRQPDTEGHLVVLAYTTLFNAIFFIVSMQLSKGCVKRPIDVVAAKRSPANARTNFIMLTMFIIVTTAYIIGTGMGLFGGLGDAAKSRGYSSGESLIRLIYEMRWFVMGLALTLFIATGNKLALGLIIGQILLNFGFSFMFGSRGHSLIAMFLLATALLSRQQKRRFSMVHFRRFLWLALSGASVVFIILFVSTLRYQGAYNDKNLTITEVFQSSGAVLEDMGDEVEDLVRGGIDRLTTSEITFIWLANQTTSRKNKGEYPYGSITDLRKMIPSRIYDFVTGRSKPRITFNYWMSHYLLGRNARNEFDLPIGRVAESFYAFRWGGLAFSVFYAVVFTLMYKHMWINSNSVLVQSMYFWIMFAYFRLGGACMTNRIPIVIQVGVFLIPVFWMMRKHRFRPASTTLSPTSIPQQSRAVVHY